MTWPSRRTWCRWFEEHLACHVGHEADGLLFPATRGGHLAPASLYRVFYPARDRAANARPTVPRPAAHRRGPRRPATGATLAELMARLGHTTPHAALRYQHAAQGRDQAIAVLLSKIALGT